MTKPGETFDDKELAAILLWTRDARGRMTFASRLRESGPAGDDAVWRFLDRVHPHDRERVEAHIGAIHAGAEIAGLEYRVRLPGSGGYRWVIEHPLPGTVGVDRADRPVSVAFDVTARKEAARRVRESGRRLRDIVEVAGDWVWEIDADLRFTYLSKQFFEHTGFRPADIIGKSRAEAAYEDTSNAVWRRHLDDLAERRPIRGFRYQVLLPDGTCKCLEINGQPLFGDDGSFRGYHGTGKDVTGEVSVRKALERSERQFRDLVEGSIQGLFIHKNWKIMFANQALADMFGYAGPDALLALDTLVPLIHPEERDRLWEYNRARERGEAAPEIYETRCQRRDGSLMWAEFRAKQVEWQGGDAIQCAVVDITDRKNAEDALRRQNEQLRVQNERFNVAIENMSQGLCMYDANRRLVVCNDRYIEMYGLPREMAKPGTPFREIIEHRIKSGIYAGDDPQAYVQERLDAIAEGVPSTKIHHLTNGRVVAITHRPMSNGGWVATNEDITELQRVQKQIAHMAHHDALTDLPNRILLRQRLGEALPLARRGHGFAVLCLDLDRFKSINDTLGHPVGDEVLKAVAERLQDCVGVRDTIARLSGDEFAIVQLSENQPQDAVALANRISQAVRKPVELQYHRVVVDTSIGIAVAPDDGLDADQLLKHADMALYRAKSDGRGVYHFFEAEMDARMQARCKLELDLRQALEQKAFELHYQPLVNLATDEISGFEALLRWEHHERGNVPPGEFIPVAEEIGLIVPLGDWVIRTACAQAAAWPAHVKVSVNLSPAQFRCDNLVSAVFRALADAKLPAGRLELEITESVLLTNTAATLETLHELRRMGVRIAMDDFGTGYSSLSYLRSFPFDKIKIDGSFVADLAEQDEASAIVYAVASLSRSLGMETTAEGVETAEQLELVRAAGYSEMQGYLFGAPCRAEEIDRLYFPPARSLASA